jgi:hypothetical protein
MKKRSPSSGQSDQLVHWWLLVHSAPMAQTLLGTTKVSGSNFKPVGELKILLSWVLKPMDDLVKALPF